MPQRNCSDTPQVVELNKEARAQAAGEALILLKEEKASFEGVCLANSMADFGGGGGFKSFITNLHVSSATQVSNPPSEEICQNWEQ